MIDLHCHILPGIDDGAQTVEEAVEMAKIAVSQGIEHILCTPHHNSKYHNPAETVIRKVQELQKVLDEKGIPLNLYEGQEVRISGDLLEQLQKGEVLCADLSNKYVLIEFPSREIPAYTAPLFSQLISKGTRPIIVHPERNREIIADPNRLLPLLKMGALAQLTAPSYLGDFGKEIKETSRLLLKNNMVQMVASDAHHETHRTFRMKQAFEQIQKDFGKRKVTALKLGAREVLNGAELDAPLVKEVKKKRFRLF